MITWGILQVFTITTVSRVISYHSYICAKS